MNRVVGLALVVALAGADASHAQILDRGGIRDSTTERLLRDSEAERQRAVRESDERRLRMQLDDAERARAGAQRQSDSVRDLDRSPERRERDRFDAAKAAREQAEKAERDARDAMERRDMRE